MTLVHLETKPETREGKNYKSITENIVQGTMKKKQIEKKKGGTVSQSRWCARL